MKGALRPLGSLVPFCCLCVSRPGKNEGSKATELSFPWWSYRFTLDYAGGQARPYTPPHWFGRMPTSMDPDLRNEILGIRS